MINMTKHRIMVVGVSYPLVGLGKGSKDRKKAIMEIQYQKIS